MDKSVIDLVRTLEKNDKNSITQYSEYVEGNMREDINKTEAYINSKHISGDKDYMGREKPFYNIVVSARNIWYRATDIDRKNIRVIADKVKNEVAAFLATVHFQEWMKKANFGQWLNDWGLTLATHGSAISKFIEKDGELHASVIDWNNILCDPIDFDNNPKVEKIWITPAQLKMNKNYDKELVKKLLDNLSIRETSDGKQKDTKDDYVLIYEVHGNLPLSYLTDKETDEDTYVQQMHIVSLQESKDDSPTESQGCTLYKGREAKDPYHLAHLIKKDGQTYAGGAVKNLFEAQWMVNHSEKQIKDQLDLASKILFQTSDKSFTGQNALTNIENGQILTHKINEPLTMLNNKADIAAVQSFKADWQNLSNTINGISEAMAGQAPKAGTAWRQVQATLQESYSLFELMTENKALSLEEILRIHVIPYFKKKLNNNKEIASILADYQIKELDEMYVPNEVIRRVNEKKKKVILSGQIYDPTFEQADVMEAEQSVRSEMKGNKRYFKPSDIPSKTWAEVLKDLEWQLDIDITGEGKDVQAILGTLTTVLQTMVSNPAVLQDPNVRMVFNKILSISGGVSPLEIQAQGQPIPAMAGAVGGANPMQLTQ